MTKAELKQQFLNYQGRYLEDEFLVNEYALHLHELLEKYLGLPPASLTDDGL